VSADDEAPSHRAHDEHRAWRIVLVTDPRYDLDRTCAVVRAVADTLGSGRVLVQLRDKEADEASLLVAAHELRKATHDVGARLVINGSLAVAARAAADGVHVPGRQTASKLESSCAAARELLGRSAIVTTAAHDDEDVRAAVLAGASAVLVSPIFATPGKGPARGLEALRAARAIVVDAARHDTSALIYALGGVSGANAAACIEAGADGVAAIRALYDDTERGELLRAVAAAARGASAHGPGRSGTP